MIDISDNQLNDFNKCEYIEEISMIHQDIQRDEEDQDQYFYEIGFSDVIVSRHLLIKPDKIPGALYRENKLTENMRIKDSIEVENIKKQLFDNKYGTFFNVYKDISSKEYAMVGVEFKPSDRSSASETGYGRSDSFKKAESQAMLEALERYAIYNMENETSIDKLMNVIENEEQQKEFSLLANEQFRCIEVINLKNNRISRLPEQLINFCVQDEITLINETSNGVSLGSSFYEAATYSLFEFIERDAFLTFWHKQVPLRRIDNSTLTHSQQKIIKEFETEDKKVYLFDLRFDIEIPTIMSLVVSKSEKPATYVSAATHLNYNIAIEGALKEAIVAHNVYRKNRAVAAKDYIKKEEVVTLSDHFNYYSKPEAIRAYDFLLDNNEMFSVEELFHKVTLRTDLEALQLVLRKMNHINDIYCCDMQNQLINQLGFVVTKVLIPEMQTMYFGYRNKRINLSRMDYAVQHSIYKDKVSLLEGEYYDEPHPFP